MARASRHDMKEAWASRGSARRSATVTMAMRNFWGERIKVDVCGVLLCRDGSPVWSSSSSSWGCLKESRPASQIESAAEKRKNTVRGIRRSW